LYLCHDALVSLSYSKVSMVSAEKTK